MKLLVDANLAPRITRMLDPHFPGSVHVRDVGLASATDDAIWSHAAQNGFAILSKDADFHQMSFLRGHPPKVIWVRLGNAATDTIAAKVSASAEHIRLFDVDSDLSFLVLGA